ncbi:MAG: hypoxanthine phosphoribosyltransferase [Verrucomicrobia bacterium]|nr:hypoxanthine phosphoribosyltransferase [Verrucomicrobiota bacterium]
MSKAIAGVLSSLDRVLLNSETIQRRVADMAREIERDFAGGELSVVTLMDGALFFVADLLRSIDLPVRLHTLTVSSYHGGTNSTGRVQMAQTLPFDLTTRRVLLIDDILDTGLTLATVRERILEECKPDTLRVAVLLSKRRQREREVPVDYAGFEIDDEFVVGYGMDYQGHYRNLPCIGILNPSRLPQS